MSQPLRSYVRDSKRKKIVLNFDLNNVPLSDNVGGAGGSSVVVDAGLGEVRSGDRVGGVGSSSSRRADARGSSVVVDAGLGEVWSSDRVGGVGSSSSRRADAIDVEAFNDDVLISSPRRFAEARERAWRNHGPAVVLVEGSGGHQAFSEERLTRMTLNRYKKRRRVLPNQGSVGSEHYVNLEGDACKKRKNTEKPGPAPPPLPPPPPPPPPPPKELAFNCPVCMNPFEEEMSTKCGHIFCKKCIKAAITAQKKCPTCRRKLVMKDLFRIYLPNAG